LDARGWLSNLLRAAYFQNPDWPTHYEEWKNHFDLPDLTKRFDPDIRPLTDYIPPAPVQPLEAPQLADMHDFERPALLLKVSLSAPDDVIIQGFKKVLSAARKRCPAPVKQRGPQVLKGRYKDEQFSTWRSYQILELADLLAWSEYENIEATDVQLGIFLGFDKRRTEVAKKELLKATSSSTIKALAAQVVSEAAG
jgi:hypothetical protein